MLEETILIEARKVQKLGNTSLVISLPKKWVNKLKLSQGDILYIKAEDDDSLRIFQHPLEEKKESEEKYLIYADKCDRPNLLERILTGCYILGYDNIVVKTTGSRLSSNSLTEIRKAINRHTGIGILEQTPNMIILQCFIDVTRFPVTGMIKRMFTLIESMLELLKQSISERDEEALGEIFNIETEVNRLYWLGIRQLILSQKDWSFAKNVGVKSPLHILGNRVIIKSIESVGDAIEDMAKAAREAFYFFEEDKDYTEKIISMIDELKEISALVQKALNKLDVIRANSVVDRVKKFRAIEEIKEISKSFVQCDAEAITSLVTILNRLIEAAKDFENIAEIVINRSLEEPSTPCTQISK